MHPAHYHRAVVSLSLFGLLFYRNVSLKKLTCFTHIAFCDILFSLFVLFLIFAFLLFFIMFMAAFPRIISFVSVLVFVLLGVLSSVPRMSVPSGGALPVPPGAVSVPGVVPVLPGAPLEGRRVGVAPALPVLLLAPRRAAPLPPFFGLNLRFWGTLQLLLLLHSQLVGYLEDFF